jgi:hypothetical protein
VRVLAEQVAARVRDRVPGQEEISNVRFS